MKRTAVPAHTPPPAQRVRITVPASSANLGSGFDALALALDLQDEVWVSVTDGGLEVSVEGQGAGEVPNDEGHLVVRALRAASKHLGFEPPGLALRCVNRIPHSRGLGSSAAACVGGVLAGYALAGVEVDEAALQLAAGFECHADNASAALYGGLVIAWHGGHGYRATRLEPHPQLRPVLLVPETTAGTQVTRGLLPSQVPHEDAAFAAGRAALAVHALTSAPEQLHQALDDRLHEPYRRPTAPRSAALVHGLRAAGIPAAVSGAGPSVLTFPGNAEIPADVDRDGFIECPLDVQRLGACVEAW